MTTDKLIQVYFLGNDSEWSDIEIQVTQDAADEIMDRLESAKMDKLFRLNLDNLINLDNVKSIKVEDAFEEEIDCEEEDED